MEITNYAAVQGVDGLIENVAVYNMANAIRASKFPMAVDVNRCNSEITNTVGKLGAQPRGSAHDNFLNGILIAFDITLTNKEWVEWERYHFQNIVSSQSTMHRIARFDLDGDVFDEHVSINTINEVKRLKDVYNEISDENVEAKADAYLSLLYNTPAGLKLTAHVVTNYGQLKTMWTQRHNHRLPRWRKICKWIESLPFAVELGMVPKE